MSHEIIKPYGEWAEIYREKGYWPRPLKFPGLDKNEKPFGKRCLEKNWQLPDHEIGAETFANWAKEFPHYNIGLVMGSPLPDGTTLAALDIDDDRLIKLGHALLNGVVSGRIGKKGIAIFCRAAKGVKNAKFRVQDGDKHGFGQVAELLAHKSLLVIPPSIHPEIDQPYKWVGQPLHDINPLDLPLIGA